VGTRIGVLGGTFNPPHRGHLELARHALRELALDRVLLMPAYTAPNKHTVGDEANDPGPAHRLAMCRLAAADRTLLAADAPRQQASGQRVRACALEIERGGVSYTVDTLEQLHASHPQAELTLIVGADVAGTLASWREPERLLELARIAVAGRPGSAAAGAALPQELAAGLAGARATMLEMPAIDVSSSLVRERVARGEAIDDLVGDDVAGYIAEHRLYRVASGAIA